MAIIEDYSFGYIVINGQSYSSDVIIYPDNHIQHPWWRQEGHFLIENDISNLLTISDISTIIIGTGDSGMLTIDKQLIDLLSAKNIETIILPTTQAVNQYNKKTATSKVAACLHLTC